MALAIGAPPKNAVDLRSFETRRFNSKDAPALLAAATATLQDLGYTITELAPDAGVLAASKQRDAKETAEVAGQIILTVALAAMGAIHRPTWAETQSIHVTFVVSPVTGGQQEARVLSTGI